MMMMMMMTNQTTDRQRQNHLFQVFCSHDDDDDKYVTVYVFVCVRNTTAGRVLTVTQGADFQSHNGEL